MLLVVCVSLASRRRWGVRNRRASGRAVGDEHHTQFSQSIQVLVPLRGRPPSLAEPMRSQISAQSSRSRRWSLVVLAFPLFPPPRLRVARDVAATAMRLCVGSATRSRFPGAPARRCRVRLQRPSYFNSNSYFNSYYRSPLWDSGLFSSQGTNSRRKCIVPLLNTTIQHLKNLQELSGLLPIYFRVRISLGIASAWSKDSPSGSTAVQTLFAVKALHHFHKLTCEVVLP